MTHGEVTKGEKAVFYDATGANVTITAESLAPAAPAEAPTQGRRLLQTNVAQTLNSICSSVERPAGVPGCVAAANAWLTPQVGAGPQQPAVQLAASAGSAGCT